MHQVRCIVLPTITKKVLVKMSFSKNTSRYNFLLLLFSFFLFVETLYIYEINHKLVASYKVKKEITSILLLNKDISLMLGSSFEGADKKAFKVKLNKQKRMFSHIQNSKYFDQFAKQPQHISVLEKLKKKFESKDGLLESFAEDRLSYKELLTKIKSLGLEKPLKKFRKDYDVYFLKLIDKLYLNMVIFLVAILFLIIVVSKLLINMKEGSKNSFRFQQAIQNSDNTIVLTDKDHRIFYVNDTFEKITGYTKEEVLHQTPALLHSGLHGKEFYENLKRKISTGRGWSGEFASRRKDGKIIYEKASIYPIKENDKIQGYLAIKLDISKEKDYIREIEAKSMENLFRYQIDYETGFWSKNILDEELYKNTSGYVIYVKMDNFEDIRFFYGTSIVNEVFKQVSLRVKDFISIYKIQGQPFRVGVDDFCLWYKEKRPPLDTLKALHSHIASSPIKLDGAIYDIDLFVGVSEDKDLPGVNRLLQGLIAS